MAAPEVAIRRLATRIRAPLPEQAFAARGLVEQAMRRLGPGVDTALQRAGLDPGTVIALPRLALRLHVEGEATAAELADAWAAALARAILAALPAARAIAPDAATTAPAGDAPTQFSDLWHAEAALLRALADGARLPWWAERIVPPDAAPADAVAALLMRWIERDAVRAAAHIAALILARPALMRLLDARRAGALAARWRDAWRIALESLVPTPGIAATDAQSAAPAATPPDGAAAALMAAIPAPLHIPLAALSPEQRAPWILALLLVRAPAHAFFLPIVVARLAALPADAWRAAAPPAGPVPQDMSARPAVAPAADQAADIWCGGLLLLIRPLARLRPAWLALGEALPPRLLALGMIGLRRLAAPLPPAARRAALERDRPLLALFAGRAPPDQPIEEAPLDPALAAEADAALAAILADAPEGIAHAPGALRRAYGRDPFAGDPASDALCRLLLRPGRLSQTETTATLVWPMDAADLALRRAGWDFDPGWVPWLGRRIAFRYGTP
jgi:hypothetical protein